MEVYNMSSQKSLKKFKTSFSQSAFFFEQRKGRLLERLRWIDIKHI